MHDSTVGRGALLCGLLAILLIGAPLLPVSGAQAALPHSGTTTIQRHVPLRGAQVRTAKDRDYDDDDDICERLHLGHDACKQLRTSRKCPPETRVITITKLVPVTKIVTVTKIVYVPVLPTTTPSRVVIIAPPATATPSRVIVTATPTPWYGDDPMF